VIRSILIGGVLALLSLRAVAADEPAGLTKKPPAEVKIVSVPASEPTEVRIISMPATPPPQVNVNVPKDESTHDLVVGTWGLFGATVVLAFGTFIVAWWQSRDTKRRDRDAMMREVSRASHKVIATATQVGAVAALVPKEAEKMYKIAGKEMPPETRKEVEAKLQSRRIALKQMSDYAKLVITEKPDVMAPLLALSDKELTERLWSLDKLQVQLAFIRDGINDELDGCEAKGAELRQQRKDIESRFGRRFER
jgi:hypothetical protein